MVADAPPAFSERLWPAWWVWASAAVLAASAGLVVARYDARAAWVTIAVVAVALGMFLVRTTPTVAVTGDHLLAGPARLPLGVLGAAEVLDAEAMRHARGPGLDARAFLLMRGWVPGGVRVRLVDPHDPTPYLLLSSRSPAALAAALDAARRAA
jgi:hypothetical protein